MNSSTDSNATELLPCPFCGCANIDEYEGDYGNGVYCMNCGAMMGEPIHMEYRVTERVSMEQAVEAWNTRTPEQAIAATLGSETCEVVGSYYYDDYDQYEFEFSCGHSVNMYDKEPPNYCPNCGKVVKR